MGWGRKITAGTGAALLAAASLTWSGVALGAAADVDWGDAPDSYGTTEAADGARHTVVPGFSLGATIDAEADAEPPLDGTGDGPDEDGLLLVSELEACTTVNVTVLVTNTAGISEPLLDAWIDWRADGTFDPSDRIATSFEVTAGTNVIVVQVPCELPSTMTFARFRLSSLGVPGPTGAASDGEVEDHAIQLRGLDFGDAPDPVYPTLLASNGARHLTYPGFSLGALLDTEWNGQPGASSLGDDVNGIDDEDGVSSGPLRTCVDATVQVVLTNTADLPAPLLNAWIDFNRDGDWNDAGERIATDQLLDSGVNDVTFTVPCSAPVGSAPARFRLTSENGIGVTGRAMHGEVEDHNLQIVSYSLPSADDDAYTVVHDRQLTGENVLDNDVAGTDAIAAVPIDGGPTDQGGVVDLAADGTFTYTPPAGFVGADTFTYELTDGVTTLEATVTIEVTNEAPELAADEPSYETPYETPLEVDAVDGLLAGASDPDGDVLTAAAVDATTAEGGTVEVEPDGSFTYTPPAGFSGEDSFEFTITDGADDDDEELQMAATATRTATITVGQAPPPPPEPEPEPQPEPSTPAPPVTAPGGQRDDALPRTGQEVASWALFGAMLLACGLLVRRARAAL